MEAAFNPERWSDFLVAQAGASAALTGLVIVAISINLKEIVGNRLLSSRAAETIGLLGGVLIVSTLVLVPGQPRQVLGAELVGVAMGVGGLAALILYRIRSLYHEAERRWLRYTLNFGAALPILAAGVSLIEGTGGGLYWLVPAVVISLVGGLINSWVLLVEILR